MRAKSLWTTWAHLALASVIAMEVISIAFAQIFLVPKVLLLMRNGVINPALLENQGVTWMASFLNGLNVVNGPYITFLLPLAAVACVLFEWRVRSENKSFIRLSVWGTAALALMVTAILIAASLVIPLLMQVTRQ
jgi:hypothetical protein